MGKLRAEIVEMRLVDQEICQLVDISHHPLEIQMVGGIEKQLWITFLDVMHARRRGSHYRTIVGEVIEELVAQLFRILKKTSIIGETSAAGLLRIVVHLHPCALQHFHGVGSHLGEELVDDTRHKQLNFHGIIRKNRAKVRIFFQMRIIIPKSQSIYLFTGKKAASSQKPG